MICFIFLETYNLNLHVTTKRITPASEVLTPDLCFDGDMSTYCAPKPGIGDLGETGQMVFQLSNPYTISRIILIPEDPTGNNLK